MFIFEYRADRSGAPDSSCLGKEYNQYHFMLCLFVHNKYNHPKSDQGGNKQEVLNVTTSAALDLPYLIELTLHVCDYSFQI